MKDWGFLRVFAVLTVVHLLMALGSFAVGFSIGLKRWDRGSAGMLESTANAIAGVLLQPGLSLLKWGIPGELEWAIVLGNSVLWGLAGALVVPRIARVVRRK